MRRYQWPLRATRAGLSMAMLGLLVAYGPCAMAEPKAAIRIEAKEFMFMPTTLTVAVGDKVTWVNKDEEPHTVVSDTGLFRSGAIDTDESFSYKFEQPGTYHFTCSIHPRMVGTIVVK